MKRIARNDTFTLKATPERVFPLLCPVREYDWIPNWRSVMIHSESGVAERDCIFRTAFPASGEMTWVVSRYEPNRTIEFTCFVPGNRVMRLDITLEGTAEGTRIHWSRRFFALSTEGEAWVENYTEAAHAESMRILMARLEHYLATGEMLRDDNRLA